MVSVCGVCRRNEKHVCSEWEVGEREECTHGRKVRLVEKVQGRGYQEERSHCCTNYTKCIRKFSHSEVEVFGLWILWHLSGCLTIVGVKMQQLVICNEHDVIRS